MKLLVLSMSESNFARLMARCLRRILAGLLMISALLLCTASIYGLNHVLFVGWVKDQRLTSSNSTALFDTVYFRIFDTEGNTPTVTLKSLNTQFIPNGTQQSTYMQVLPCQFPQDNGVCASDGTGWKILFPTHPDHGDGWTAITVKSTDTTTGLVGETSFTLQLDTAGRHTNPPSLSSLPNQAIARASNSSSVTCTTKFVIGDVSETGKEDITEDQVFTVYSSDNAIFNPGAPGAYSVTLLPPDPGYSTEEGPRSYLFTVTTNTTAAAHGYVTVSLMATDPADTTLTTSTSFVLYVVDPGNSPPIISKKSTQLVNYAEYTISPAVFSYHVASAKSGIKVISTSSNTSLVPHGFINNNYVAITAPDGNGDGTVTITPVLPLPDPGAPQSATITLSALDDEFISQTSFLFVATPPDPYSVTATSYTSPSGVYLEGVTTNHRSDDAFVSGEMHRISWKDLERDFGDYQFTAIDQAVRDIPFGQDISLNLTEEPCYITDITREEHATYMWCDTDPLHFDSSCPTCNDGTNDGIWRAAPWDSYLQERRVALFEAMKMIPLSDGYYIPDEPAITIINPNLPGGDTGIQNPSTMALWDMPNYSRANLLKAVQIELHNMQYYFPKKLVQFGFFPIDEDSHPGYTDTLWQWLYREAGTSPYETDEKGVPLVPMGDEFNGTRRPRVSFFQEDLAAARGSADPPPTIPPSASGMPNYVAPSNTKAYSITPAKCSVPSFAYYCPILDVPCTCTAADNRSYNNGIVFQANCPWSSPFVDKNGDKLIKTLNGSPNDGMEGAFNTYHSQYLEIYEQDADRAQPTDQSLPTADVALWASELQGWHDYSVHLRSLPPIEGPAGLTVDRTDSTHNTVSWYTVYDANSYTVQKQALTNPPSTWSNVSGCSSTTNTQCQDLSSTGTEYAYRVQAVGSQYSSAWSYVGVFLSESTSTTNYDGYVELKNGIKTPKNAAGQPGIRAGEGNTMMGVFPYWRGIVSFNTSLLGSTTTILGAKLRLNQATPGTYFGTGGLGTCMVDTKKGHFGNSLALEGMDYDSTDWTTQNAFPVVNVGQYNWFDAYLSTTAAQANIANTDHTQFRIYFNQGPANKNEGWYSGETNTSTPSTPPHLIVQYQQ